MIRAFTLFLLTFSFSVNAGVDIEKYVPNAQIVGEGQTSFYFWKLYDASLFSPHGKWNPESPFALSLRYDIEASAEEISKTSIEEIRRAGFTDEILLATWYRQMLTVFRDVMPGDQIVGIRNTEGDSIFMMNGEYIGSIKGNLFSDRFFGIWLDKTTRKPDLRKKLLGLSHAN